MKKLIVLGIVAAMVMGLAAASSAAVDAKWLVYLRPISNNGAGTSQGNFNAGTLTGAIDAWRSTTDLDGNYGSPTAGAAELGTSIKDATNVDHLRTQYDTRAPLAVGETKIWDIYLRINGGAPGNIKLLGWTPSGWTVDSGDEMNVSLWLASDYGVAGKTALWSPAKGVITSSTTGFSMSNIAYDGTDIMFKLVAAPAAPPVITPEPGSMLAMLSGMVGLVGYGIRRRK